LYPRSDHCDGRRFFNAGGPTLQPFTAVPRLLLERRRPWPAPRDLAAARPLPRGDASAIVTFVGHSTFLIETAAANVLTDPMYSTQAGPWNVFGPRRVRRPAVALEDLPRISAILLSHNHYDHCDVPTLRALARRGDPLVVTPLGNAPLVRWSGIRRVEELDWWEHARSTPLPVALTPAHHFSARTPFDRNRALWGGFVVAAGSRRIYFAGDTAYAAFFPEIARRLGPIDLALLPVGAYEPRWFMRGAHMNPAEAVQAHLELGAAASVGMHFGTFRLTTEGIDDPLRDLEEALRQRGVPESRFRTLAFGESLMLE
jgi:L-ascorbate metabolism protein UlaG (beta-lactamase superfamily)